MLSSPRLVHRSPFPARSPRQGSRRGTGPGPFSHPTTGEQADRLVPLRRPLPPCRPDDGLTAPCLEAPATVPDGGGLDEAMRGVHMENVHPLRLRLLLEIGRLGSISAAAEACVISQPSASVHLRTLEMAIGHRLVTRNGRGSRLTAAGELVASHAARVLATLGSMRRALDAMDARDAGELTIAASLMPSVALVPVLLRQFSERYPGVSVKLRTVPSGTVVRDVARGAADIGIGGEVQTTEQVVSRQILVDELVGIAQPGLVTPDHGRISPGALAGKSLLAGPAGSSTRVVTERYLTRAGCWPASVWEFDSYEAIKQAVSEGLGVSFMSRLLVSQEVDEGELTAFRVSGAEPMQRPIHLVQSGAAEPTPEGSAFVALVGASNLGAAS